VHSGLAGVGGGVAQSVAPAGPVLSLMYGTGLAEWDERADLDARFGAPWHAYRAAVRKWVPQWRPFDTGRQRGAFVSRRNVRALRRALVLAGQARSGGTGSYCCRDVANGIDSADAI
jgi:hypothetical protein